MIDKSVINELLTESEAAKYLKISERTLQAWRCTGAGPAFVRIGRAILPIERHLGLDKRQHGQDDLACVICGCSFLEAKELSWSCTAHVGCLFAT